MPNEWTTRLWLIMLLQFWNGLLTRDWTMIKHDLKHTTVDMIKADLMKKVKQWLKANSQKAEAKQWKSCPYCRSKDPDANAEIYKNGDEYLAIGSDGNVEIDEGNLVMEENYYLYQESLFKFCPMCGRPLGGNEDDD